VFWEFVNSEYKINLDIPVIIPVMQKEQISTELNLTTITRRASTVKAWFDWMFKLATAD
jgi:hypothetical protein